MSQSEGFALYLDREEWQRIVEALISTRNDDAADATLAKIHIADNAATTLKPISYDVCWFCTNAEETETGVGFTCKCGIAYIETMQVCVGKIKCEKYAPDEESIRHHKANTVEALHKRIQQLERELYSTQALAEDNGKSAVQRLNEGLLLHIQMTELEHTLRIVQDTLKAVQDRLVVDPLCHIEETGAVSAMIDNLLHKLRERKIQCGDGTCST